MGIVAVAIAEENFCGLVELRYLVPIAIASPSWQPPTHPRPPPGESRYVFLIPYHLSFLHPCYSIASSV